MVARSGLRTPFDIRGRVMKLPDLDPGGGPLRLDQVFLDYDGPQLFSARNKGSSRYLGLHTLAEGKSDRWLYVRVSPSRIRELSNGRFPIREAFFRPEYGDIALYAYEERGDYFGQESLKWFPPGSVPVDLLPDENAYLESEVDERVLMLAKAAAPPALRSVLERAVSAPMWEIDPQVLMVLRGLRTRPHVAASASRRSVIDLAFAINENRTDFPARSLSAVLGVTQSLVDALGAEGTEIGSRGRLSEQIIGATSLDAVATFPSSFGLRLESNAGDLAGSARVERALKTLLGLLRSSNSKESLELALRDINRRSQNHFKAFFKAVASGKSDFNIEAATPDEHETGRIYFTVHQVNWVAKFLDKAVEADERSIDFRGRLLAVSLKTKFFLLRNDEGEEISGRIANDCVKKIDEKKINVEYLTTVIQRTEVNEATGEETSKYELKDIKET